MFEEKKIKNLAGIDLKYDIPKNQKYILIGKKTIVQKILQKR